MAGLTESVRTRTKRVSPMKATENIAFWLNRAPHVPLAETRKFVFDKISLRKYVVAPETINRDVTARAHCTRKSRNAKRSARNGRATIRNYLQKSSELRGGRANRLN